MLNIILSLKIAIINLIILLFSLYVSITTANKDYPLSKKLNAACDYLFLFSVFIVPISLILLVISF